MKRYQLTTLQIFITLTAIFSATFLGCKKENMLSVKQTTLTEENSDAEVFSAASEDTTRLVLRPGPHAGNDAYIEAFGFETTNNFGNVPELPIKSWINGGSPIINYSYIKFTQLSLVPATANVLSAHLYLYGMSASVTTPLGNVGDNSCWVQRITERNWDESTITYENAPQTTTEDQATLRASTSTWNYNASINVTEMVKKMIADPSINYGFAIKLKDGTSYKEIVFASSESEIRTLRPRLVVVYQ